MTDKSFIDAALIHDSKEPEDTRSQVDFHVEDKHVDRAIQDFRANYEVNESCMADAVHQFTEATFNGDSSIGMPEIALQLSEFHSLSQSCDAQELWDEWFDKFIEHYAREALRNGGYPQEWIDEDSNPEHVRSEARR